MNEKLINLVGVCHQNVLNRGEQSGRGLPCEKLFNLEKS
jgi:hypothetical protein